MNEVDHPSSNVRVHYWIRSSIDYYWQFPRGFTKGKVRKYIWATIDILFSRSNIKTLYIPHLIVLWKEGWVSTQNYWHYLYSTAYYIQMYSKERLFSSRLIYLFTTHINWSGIETSPIDQSTVFASRYYRSVCNWWLSYPTLSN